jgi:hypothetical protein
MTPIFDSDAQLVGWFDGEHIFDTDQNWKAFVRNGHVFSAESLDWLGPVHDGSFLDTRGKPVGWLSGSSPSGTLTPLTPLRPLRPLTPLKPLRPLTPLKPLKPLTPLGGWSDSTWHAWLKA